MVALELNDLTKVLLSFLKLTDPCVCNTDAVESFDILVVFFERLGTVFDCIVVVLKLIVAVSKINAHNHLDLFNELDSLLLCRNDRILVHLEQHLEGNERLVVVLDSLLILLLLHAKIAVKSLDVRHEELVLRCAHRVVFNNYALFWCA